MSTRLNPSASSNSCRWASDLGENVMQFGLPPSSLIGSKLPNSPSVPPLKSLVSWNASYVKVSWGVLKTILRGTCFRWSTFGLSEECCWIFLVYMKQFTCDVVNRWDLRSQERPEKIWIAKKKHKLGIPKPTMILRWNLVGSSSGDHLQVFAPQVQAVMMPNWPVICDGWRRRWNSVQQPVMVCDGVRGSRGSREA